MNLSEISSTLREIRVSPVKTLGQNFLHDRNLARWIVDAAQLTTEDFVVEIGPGLGALTEFALASGGRVLAIEKDARLAEFVRERFKNEGLEVWHGDALDFDLRRLFTESHVKVLGNLPYYVASQLLLKFLDRPSPISLALLMLQNEMARRLSAAPRSAAYGALTLLVQLDYRIEYLRSVPATVFLPEPDVDSALVRVVPRRSGELPEHDRGRFKRLVRLGFSQRRKQLQKLLRTEVSNWSEAAESCHFAPQARAEELGLEQWIALSNWGRAFAPLAAARVETEMFPVVDAEDQLVKLAARSEVHGDNLRHRAVHIFLFNTGGELFLQKRSASKDRHPGMWDSSAAGHLEGREEYDEAAARELEEELGVVASLERILKLPPSEETGQEFIWLYRGQHDGPLQLNAIEIDTGGFFPPDIVERWIGAKPCEFAPGFVECWNAWRATQKPRARDL